MFKFLTILLLVGASHLVVPASSCTQEINCTVLLLNGSVSEQVADQLFDQAAVEWQETKSKLWTEYRNNLITIKKIGVINGDPVYLVDRLKTGGSLVLILDVEAA